MIFKSNVIQAWGETEWLSSPSFDPFSRIENVPQDYVCSSDAQSHWMGIDSDSDYEVAKRQCQNFGNGNFPELDGRNETEERIIIDKIQQGK